ncbi:MAG: 3-phosphoshikimate 1-carboxyvinyltransferase [Gammaproteobacteria bacterium]|nr:3-phosphoshikimate 1-carboxyvinyltransferase [Gammaproteobacteria bacterium]NNF50060.1 3-phosphoshikimate 1-carboxyvinyltransferase [Woeseiaceae bacterium]
MDFLVTPSRLHDAVITVPGDKSISHRALMLGAVARGRTEVRGFLNGDDCLATADAMRALGVEIRMPAATDVVIEGVGLRGLQPPKSDLDLGNSGTAMRLLAGLLAGQRFGTTLRGDESLNSRPMARVVTPLTRMGAAIETDCDGTPPLQIAGGLALRAIHYEMPVASAQVKSAVLLAGLYATGDTSVSEPAVTRDHTERMLRSLGVSVASSASAVTLVGGQEPRGTVIEVPGDLSSATFPMLATLLSQDADTLVKDVGVNPTRCGVIDIFRGMGADISLENTRRYGDEPVADIRVRASRLRGGVVDPGLVSLAIDEFPALFVAAAAAEGTTHFSGLAELRVKESDRLAAMADGLRRLGIAVEETADGATVEGGRFTGGEVNSYHDHRVAMALAMAGTIADDEVLIRGVDNVATSFPGFRECVAGLGADVRLA